MYIIFFLNLSLNINQAQHLPWAMIKILKKAQT